MRSRDHAAGTLAVPVAYDHAAGKLLAFETGGATGAPLGVVGNTESLAGFTVRVLAIP